MKSFCHLAIAAVSPTISVFAAIVILLLPQSFCASALAETVDPMVRPVVPADGRLTITDYGFRNWGPELVQYTVDTGRFKPGQCGLVNDQGQWLPCQIDGNVLSFVASVPRGGKTEDAVRHAQRVIDGLKKTYGKTWKIGLAVPDGERELAVRNLVFPNVWTRPFTPLIEGR